MRRGFHAPPPTRQTTPISCQSKRRLAAHRQDEREKTAKGTHSDRSAVDLVVAGDVEPLRAEAIASELDELPLPYRFEVQSLDHIQHRPLLEHIRRVGVLIYPGS